MAQSMEVLKSAAEEVSTSSTKQRTRIFREKLPPLLQCSELSSDVASLLVDVIFQTLPIYDDRSSRKAVDDLIVKALGQSTFMKSFAAALVQFMERHQKSHSPVGCYKLLKWSCVLLQSSQFAFVSKGGFLRLATAQAFLCQDLMSGSFRSCRACKMMFFHLFSESPDIYKMYIEELKDARISIRDSAELLRILLIYSIRTSPIFEQYKSVFLEIYVKAVLNANDKPSRALVEAFLPLFMHTEHEDFKTLVFPSCVKMLKRNPEIVLESIGELLKSVKLDLSKYASEFLAVVLPQVRHAEEGRRVRALGIIGCLSQMSSDPDTQSSMFNSIKNILGGSEGKLTVPYQRVGMVNSIQELSKAPGGKGLNKLAPSVSCFLVSFYKDDGSEEVKVAVLSALASWASRSAETVQPDVVSFIASGLREKEILRKGHLRCLQVMCKNSDSLTRISPLLDPLIQLVKTGFTKASQRLDGIYALYSVSKIVTLDTKAEEILQKEKLWTLIAQNESSLISIPLVSKLSKEDCITCIDLLEALFTDHLHRVSESLSVRSLLQLLVYLTCHPSWHVRKVAHDATRKITSSSSGLVEDILIGYTNWLCLVGDRISVLKASDSENSVDPQMPFLPSPEVLVKGLLLIAPAAIATNPATSSRLLFCSHHPYFIGTGCTNAVWKRLQRNLRRHGFDVVDIAAANVGSICKDLLGPMGLMSSNTLEQQAALCSLAELMKIAPNETFSEFEMHFNKLPDRYLHDELSESDIKIFYTPEGELSIEQGVYIAETVTAKNTKLAKGRFRAYEDQNGTDNFTSSHSVQPNKREATTTGKRDTGKANRKNDKPKSAKEEARELLLKEEASIRERVRCIQKNISAMLQALGEMAIANPVFTHGQLPLLVNYVQPLLRSPIVSDDAFDTMLKLAKCIAPPLCNWALQLTSALRIISTENAHIVWELLPSSVAKGEVHTKPSAGIFEQIVTGLSVSCKTGPLPADSFTFVFPIMEQILLSSKKTALHGDVLRILSMHLDPILPLPRPRMLSVLYHVLGVVPAHQASIGPMLNELCLGLQVDEVAIALSGVDAKDVHVRLACLNAVKCIPSISGRSLPQNLQIATRIWIALHDPEKAVAEAAEEVWDRYGFDFGTDYSGLFDALSHVNYNVRVASAEALAAVLDENPDTIQILVLEPTCPIRVS